MQRVENKSDFAIKSVQQVKYESDFAIKSVQQVKYESDFAIKTVQRVEYESEFATKTVQRIENVAFVKTVQRVEYESEFADPMEYWRNNHASFPLLAKYFMAYSRGGRLVNVVWYQPIRALLLVGWDIMIGQELLSCTFGQSEC